MANRPVFVPCLTGDVLVNIKNVEFEWFAGMSGSQKKKSMNSLHNAYLRTNPNSHILEVSSKSGNDLGIALSAFNLSLRTHSNQIITVENVFQSSKVFESGGAFKDLLYKTPREAKTDPRLKSSGNLIKFTYKNQDWELEPKTAFYDWVYLNFLNQNDELKIQVLNYNAFTDIEFNPSKSINCQAYSVALYVALAKRNLLRDNVIPEKDEFIALIRQFDIKNSSDGSLF